jgi:3-ketosteroid 9alpha-monooxygenase subunit A
MSSSEISWNGKPMYRGWHQVAFDRDLKGELTAATIGDLPLLIVRSPDGVAAFDAVCPHRGAHLAYGGHLDGQVIVCPFHGRRIGLGNDCESSYCVRAYRTLEVGGLVFVLLSERHENGFTALMKRLQTTHFFLPGFTISARIFPDMVIENAFDKDHFKYVHGINQSPDLRLQPSQNGEMAVEGIFLTNCPNPWQQDFDTGAAVQTRFFARVFSPNLCVTELGDEHDAYLVITAATPMRDGNCMIRVSIAVSPTPDGTFPSKESILALLRDSQTSFEQDMVIWENISREASQRLWPDDEMVGKYHEFCARFLE